MSRPLRIEYEGAWSHVMNRGRRSDRIFEGRKDYLLFIDLLKAKRGCFNEPRSMAIYLARILRKDSLMDIGSNFGFRGYRSVSSVSQGIGKQLLKNRRLQKRYEVLKKALIIGQPET